MSPRKRDDNRTKKQRERDRRFEWEPGDVTYTPPDEVAPEEISPERPRARRK